MNDAPVLDPITPLLSELQKFVDRTPDASEESLVRAMRCAASTLGMVVREVGTITVRTGTVLEWDVDVRGWSFDAREWFKTRTKVIEV